MSQICTRCGSTFTTTNKSNKYCTKECWRAKQNAYGKAYKATTKGKEVTRNRHLKVKYGISLEDYRAMLSAQNNCCAICRSHKNNCRRQEWFHVDHDHFTGRVRGLLCSKCNAGIAMFNEIPEVIEQALFYVSANQEFLDEL